MTMRDGSILTPTTIGDAAIMDPSWNAEAMSWIGSMVCLPTPSDVGIRVSSWENERSPHGDPGKQGLHVGSDVKA